MASLHPRRPDSLHQPQNLRLQNVNCRLDVLQTQRAQPTWLKLDHIGQSSSMLHVHDSWIENFFYFELMACSHKLISFLWLFWSPGRQLQCLLGRYTRDLTYSVLSFCCDRRKRSCRRSALIYPSIDTGWTQRQTQWQCRPIRSVGLTDGLNACLLENNSWSQN